MALLEIWHLSDEYERSKDGEKGKKSVSKDGTDEALAVPCAQCAIIDNSLAILAGLFLAVCIGTAGLAAAFTIAPPPIHGFTSPVQ
jgi:hypothetical protein